MDTLAVPSDGLDAQALQKRKSFDSSMRPTNPVLRSPSSSISLSTNGASVSNGLTVSDASRKDRRRSINPAMSLAFTKSLPPTAPLHIHGRESPLREYFSSEEQTSFPPPYADSASLIPPRNNTPSPVPTHSPGSSLHLLSDSQRVTAGRARSASSSTYSEHIPDHPSALSRPSLTLDRVPVRSSSLAEPFEARVVRSPPQRLLLRDTIPLNLLNGNTIRPQRSFDDRPRASPPPLRNSRSSNGDLELHSRPGSGSVPPSPSHHVDVPHGIESGTDTEAESEEAGSAGHSKQRLPTLPPKDEAERGNSRTPTLWVDTIDISHDGRPDSEWTSESPESSPVERTSIATFIAPALPPIRISMGGGDFSDLLKSMDIGGLKSPDQFVGIKGDGKLMLDLTLTPSGMTGPAPMSTPSSEITVLGSGAMYSDRVDTKHRDLSREREDTASPSLSSSSHGHASSKGHSSLGAGRGSVDGSSESSHFSITDYSSAGSDFADTRPSLDARRTRQDRFGSNVAASRDASANARGVARITVTAPDDAGAKMARSDTSDSIKRHLQEAVAFAAERGVVQVCLDIDFAQSVIMLLDQRREEYNELKRNIDGMKRASQQYMDGLTVAQTEYDRELKARRDAEAEVTRLRVLLSGQAVRLTAISGDTKRQEAQRQLSRELRDNLSSLEKDVSKLKAMRDMTLAEVEQLSASNSSTLVADSEESGASIGTALSMRFDNIKTQYQHELIPLTEQRETLMREIAELKASRDAFLEETTVLNARNEELAQLNAQYVRRVENTTVESAYTKQETVLRHKHGNSLDRARSPPMLSHSLSSSTLAASEESAESKFVKVSRPDNADAPGPQFRPPKFIKWGSKAPKENAAVPGTDNNKPKSRMEHIFQQVSVLRVARCDHCGDKMWGSQFRCANCNIAVHTRCIHHVNLPCSQQTSNPREEHHAPSIAPLPPSMFGRDLIEQVRADSRNERRFIPVIVEKCIDAVDGLALEYEGIYRKTGGAGQSKTITQLFERGDYQAFDLRDTERFNDICSVTSVLKTYFRSLPNPLFTHALHEEFVNATSIRDQAIKSRTFQELVKELPQEHYYTTRAMMLHLHRVRENSDKNLMHARNLGVVFGPTLMRSRDPGAEFSDMAGKALCIEYLVENAPSVFDQPPPSR
ncbi:putative Rho-type GTPase-activating protein 3 [Grifola frondosa]|uniref:Putative Rho-type GTPase-activating protein 3 n=1 Tax=Grifola frondosa TaxID=5627 RepID=A0A1C7M1S5_GRIFR|nr:putative Rho-type GTPase-activating protein 3 [Grifola frondosa]